MIEQWLRRHTRNTAHKATTLTRYYLIECRFFSLCLHHFIKDDEAGKFHDHPFDWVSFFWGSYVEEQIDGSRRKRWLMNSGGKTFHRVEGMAGRWSLCLRGPEYRDWSYKTGDDR